MKRFLQLTAGAGCALLLLLFFSCATTGAFRADQPKVRMVHADQQELRQFGATYARNPYLDPITLLGGKKFEFYVIRLDLNLPGRTDIAITGQARSVASGETLRLYTRSELQELWELLGTTEDSADVETRKSTIGRTALPAMDFIERSGSRSYYIVIGGKYPVRKPVEIEVSAYLSSGESFVFRDVWQ
ncbi:MAG: hypothetical protein WHT81_02425 [Rectinemataceae bacterium]|nr:hypothetical protein [Spirochaetaceae bacterium]